MYASGLKDSVVPISLKKAFSLSYYESTLQVRHTFLIWILGLGFASTNISGYSGY